MQSQRALPPGPALCGGRVDLGIGTMYLGTRKNVQTYKPYDMMIVAHPATLLAYAVTA